MFMIEVDGITRLYGDRPAVEDLSFRVKKGSVHGFLGPNGAGKTTTMKMISGLLPPHAGSIKVGGLDVMACPHEVKKKIGILLEVPPLFMDMEVRDYLTYAAKLRQTDKSKVNAWVEESIEKLGLGDMRKRLVGNLSKGYKQKVGVAQAIVHKPALVILDEPTSGLDPKAVIEMRALIRELKAEHTVLFSSHLLKEADLVCDDVTIIAGGKLMGSASIEDIGRSISQKSVIGALVKRVSAEDKEALESLGFIESCAYSEEGEGTRIKALSGSLDDHREELSQFIVSRDLGLLEFTSEKPDLEKIFLEMTKSADSSEGPQ